MLQSITTLIFAAAGFGMVGLVALLLAGEWDNVLRSLGLGQDADDRPLPPRIRMVATRRVPVLRVSPEAMKRAA